MAKDGREGYVYLCFLIFLVLFVSCTMVIAKDSVCASMVRSIMTSL